MNGPKTYFQAIITENDDGSGFILEIAEDSGSSFDILSRQHFSGLDDIVKELLRLYKTWKRGT